MQKKIENKNPFPMWLSLLIALAGTFISAEQFGNCYKEHLPKEINSSVLFNEETRRNVERTTVFSVYSIAIIFFALKNVANTKKIVNTFINLHYKKLTNFLRFYKLRIVKIQLFRQQHIFNTIVSYKKSHQIFYQYFLPLYCIR